MDPSRVRKTSFAVIHRKKALASLLHPPLSYLPPPGHITPPPRDDLIDDNFKAFNGPVKEWMIIKQSSLCPLSASLFQSWVVISEEV